MRSILTATLALAILSASPTANHAQNGAPLAGAVLDHVGVAVRDIDAAARYYAEVFGVPASNPVTVTAEAPSGKATFKTARLLTANFQIELAQPVGNNVLSSWLDKYGDGVQHVGVTVPDMLSSRVGRLVSRGGVVTLGHAEGAFALVDLTSLVGTTIEVAQRAATVVPRPAPPPARPGTLVLAASLASHVGLLVPDIEKTARTLADLLGVPLPRFAVTPNPALPPDYAGDPGVSVKTVRFLLGDVAMEYQQASAGKNPWNDFAQRHGGAAAHYVAFRLGDQLDAMRRQLEEHGARMVVGNAGSPYSHYVLSRPGLMIEVLGTPKK